MNYYCKNFDVAAAPCRGHHQLSRDGSESRLGMSPKMALSRGGAMALSSRGIALSHAIAHEIIPPCMTEQRTIVVAPTVWALGEAS